MGRLMKVTVRTFAVYRELLGKPEFALEVPVGATALSVMEMIFGDKMEQFKGLESSTLFAINREYVKSDCVLEDGDELSVLPPLAGGN